MTHAGPSPVFYLRPIEEWFEMSHGKIGLAIQLLFKLGGRITDLGQNVCITPDFCLP